MMNIADTFLMVGIAITTSAVGELYLGEGIKRYDDAVAACRDNNRRLVLPLNDAHNQWIEEYMNDQSQLLMSWIDLQIYPHGWQVLSTGVTLYNQGCYSNSTLVAVHKGRYSSIKACMEFCSSKSTKYAAFQRRDSTGHCICPQSIPVISALAESSCKRQCPDIEGIFCGDEQHMSYRVLTINGATNVPLWDMPTPPPQQSVQCAAHYWRTEDITIFHNLLPKYCFDLQPSLCLNPNGNLTAEIPLNWFEAHKKCHEAGGHLFLPSFNLNLTPSWPQNVPHWTGVTAWDWTSGSHIDRDLFYTNWTGLSDITMNNCVLMNPRGAWEITTCDTSRGYICESGNFSIPERTTPVAPTTSTSNADTGSTITALYSQGTDIDTDTTAHTEYSTLFTEHSTYQRILAVHGGENIEIGIPVGVSLALVAIIVTIVAAILIYRRMQQKTITGAPVMKNHPPSNQTCDNTIREPSVTALGHYELTDISGEGAKSDPSYTRGRVANVAPDQDGEACTDDNEEPPVYGTPDKGRTVEGVLIVDNELYGDC